MESTNNNTEKDKPDFIEVTSQQHHEMNGLEKDAGHQNITDGHGDVADEEFNWTFTKFMAILGIYLPYMADIVYITGAGGLLAIINEDIGPSNSYSWIVTAFAVVSAVLSPLVGRLSDIFGRRNFLLVGNIFGLIAAAMAATCHEIDVFVGASALAGIGVALHQISFTAVSEMVPKRSRGLALGAIESGLGLPGAFAPLIGYAMDRTSSWRNLFWLIFAIQGGSFFLLFFFYHPINQYIKEEGRSRFQQSLSLDWVGFFLFLTGLVLFLLGISFGGNQFAWTSAGTIAPIIVGFALLIACGFWEAYKDLEYPFFPPIVFRNLRGFTLVNVGIFVIGMSYYSGVIVWPQQIQTLYATDLITAGSYNSASNLGGFMFAALSGWIFKKTAKLQWWFRGVIVGITLMCGCQAIVTPMSNISSTVLALLVGGLVGASTVVGTMIIQVGIEHEYLGVATGIVACARSVGGAVATTIYSSILVNSFPKNLPTDVAIPLIKAGVPPTNVQSVIEALLSGVSTNPVLATLSPTQLEAGSMGIKWAYAHTFRLIYLVSIAFGGIGIICSIFVANVDKFMTTRIDIQLEEGVHIHGQVDTGAGHFIKHDPHGEWA